MHYHQLLPYLCAVLLAPAATLALPAGAGKGASGRGTAGAERQRYTDFPFEMDMALRAQSESHYLLISGHLAFRQTIPEDDMTNNQLFSIASNATKDVKIVVRPFSTSALAESACPPVVATMAIGNEVFLSSNLRQTDSHGRSVLQFPSPRVTRILQQCGSECAHLAPEATTTTSGQDVRTSSTTEHSSGRSKKQISVGENHQHFLGAVCAEIMLAEMYFKVHPNGSLRGARVSAVARAGQGLTLKEPCGRPGGKLPAPAGQYGCDAFLRAAGIRHLTTTTKVSCDLNKFAGGILSNNQISLAA